MRYLVRLALPLVATALLASGCLSWRAMPVEPDSARCVRGGGRWIQPSSPSPASIPICEIQSPGFL